MRSIRKTLILSALAVTAIAFPGDAFAQDDETISVETNLVNVGVVAKDRSGSYVPGLGKESFRVYDNGHEQEIVLFSGEAAPVTYGFVYDLHPTTSERTKKVLESIRAFTERLGEEDDFFTIVFNERGSLVLGFVPTVEQVTKHLSLGEKGEPNSLYDAIALAAEKSEERSNTKRTLIVITDGKDDDSHHSFKQLSSRLKPINVQIFAVFVGERTDWTFSDITLDKQPRALDKDLTLDRAAIDELARSSGGRSQEPLTDNVLDLVRIYNRIGLEMKQQYSLGFYPVRTDGKWHKLKVTFVGTTAGALKLSYRKGYQSPKPAQ